MRDTATYRPALATLTVLFFMWGFITSLNDILIPYLKGIFELDTWQAMLVNSAFFGAYFVGSLPAGTLVGRLGYQRGIVLGLSVTGLGAFLFYPASALASYPAFLVALFILALGITVLQVAANPYVTMLGPPHTASSRLNLTQGLNSAGTIVGPQVGTALLLGIAGASALEQAEAVQAPYLGIALFLGVLALVFATIRLPVIHESDASGDLSLASERTLWLGVGAIFAYVGAEVTIGSMIVLVLVLPEMGGMTEKVAGSYVSVYWGAAMIGRFVGAALQQRMPAHRLLGIHALLAIALLLTAVVMGGVNGAWLLLLVGYANSIMFPTIFSLSIAGLGAKTSRGAGFLVMAIVGGALIPPAIGYLGDSLGLLPALAITAVCYGYILFFAADAGRARKPSGVHHRPLGEPSAACYFHRPPPEWRNR